MNQQLARTTTMLPSLPADREQRQLVVAARLSELQLSPRSAFAVIARLAGTTVRTATEEQLSSMWTEVSSLLKLQFTSDEEEEQFYDDLLDLNDWLRRQYGPKGTTCEEVRLAYNYLVMEELRKDDGRVLEAYPKLNPRHVGEVLAAYNRHINADRDVNRVIAGNLYLPPAAEPTEAEINAQMEQHLREAISWVKNGNAYNDIGNGLYYWLYKTGRLRPDEDQWADYLDKAQSVLNESLAEQQQTASQYAGYAGPETKRDPTFEHLRNAIAKRLSDVLNRQGDYRQRVRAEAMRLAVQDFLVQHAGTIVIVAKPLPATPKLELPAEKPFSHLEYIESLKAQLPTMGDEQLSDLQRRARSRNVLDVYELTTAEWNRRQALKPTHREKEEPRK